MGELEVCGVDVMDESLDLEVRAHTVLHVVKGAVGRVLGLSELLQPVLRDVTAG